MKTRWTYRLAAFCGAWLCWCNVVHGAPGALLLGGATGDESGMRRGLAELDLFEACVATAGVAPDAVVRLDERAVYDAAALDRALAGIAEQVAAGTIDELWVGVFGHAQPGRRELLLKLPRGVYAAPRLAAALDALPVPQRIFCFNTLSCELAELLSASGRADRFLVAAISAPGKRQPPGIPGFFLRLWRDGAAADFLELTREATLAAQRSAAGREIFFEEQPLLVVGARRAEFPFAELTAADLPPMTAAARDADAAVATDAAAPSPEAVAGFDAHLDRRQLLLSLNADGALHIAERCEIVIHTATGAERLTAIQLPPPGGAAACEILEAASIGPDGSAGTVTVRPEQMQLRFPGLKPGSRIVYAYTWDEAMTGAAKSAAFLSREVELAREYPQRQVEFTFSLPKKFPVAWRVYGWPEAVAPTVEETPYNRVYHFNFPAIAAAETLPDVPPEVAAGGRVVFSMVPDWATFAAQYLALIDGCDRLNAEGAALARSLTATAADAAGQLEQLYAFVNALRYDSTPYGVRALRPRLPEAVLASGTADCKDKANLLIAFARELGIAGHLALVRRGGAADPDFPSWQFNHAVAYFPAVAGFPDGLWLDATDTETPFGTLPPGDAGRPALVLDQGGDAHFLTMTPGRAPENIQLREWRLTALPDGGVSGVWRQENRGIFAYFARHDWKNRSPQQRLSASQAAVAADWRAAEVTAARAESGANGALTLAADWSADAPEAVALSGEWLAPFAMARRGVPLSLYDGQSHRLAQRVCWNGGAPGAVAELVEEWDSPHYTARLTRRGTAATWELELTVECDGGVIAAEEYPADRALWRAAARRFRSIQEEGVYR